MKVVTVLGARPQFIKAAPVAKALKEKNIEEIVIHSGQHFDANMSDIFFTEMNIDKPKYSLGINQLGHGAMTGRMLEKIEEVLITEKPDVVIVYGDTNTTLAAAIAAKKLHIPIAHIEAGLRSFNTLMPEEVNRILTDRVSKYLFCPTDSAAQNLKQEGFDKFDCEIHKVGDVMQDAAILYAEHAKKPPGLSKKSIENGYVLATLHRAENTDDPVILRDIVEAINRLHHDGMLVVLPLHPRTKKKLEEQNIELSCEVLQPASYLEMLFLLKNARMVMTDSGGLQKEAYFFAKPCITLRTETEWVELIKSGVNQLAPLNIQGILASVEAMLNKNIDTSLQLYGCGNAGLRIAEHLSNA